MHDGFDVQLLGGQQRKAVLQVEAHLVAEYRAGAGAGAVSLFGAMFIDMAHEIEILAHGNLVLLESEDCNVFGVRTDCRQATSVCTKHRASLVCARLTCGLSVVPVWRRGAGCAWNASDDDRCDVFF